MFKYLRKKVIGRSRDQTRHSSPDPRTLEQEQFDARYCDQLTRRRELSCVTQAKSLRDLAMLAVVNMVTNCAICDVRRNPLAGLPGLILHAVLDAMICWYGPQHFNVVKYFLTERCKTLALIFKRPQEYVETWQPWSLDTVELLLQVMENCQNQLIKLAILVFPDSDNSRPTTLQINTILRHQSSLVELRLGTRNINNESMAIIGSTCQHLRLLNVAYNKEITNTGLIYLCSSQRPYGKCTNIRDLNIEGTTTTPSGIALLMCKLPQLEELKTTRNFHSILLAICKYNPHTKLLKFKKLSLNCTLEQIQNHCVQIISIIPNVTEMKMKTDHEIKPLLKLHQITSINISFVKNVPPELVIMLEKLKPNLTEVKLYSETLTHINCSILSECPKLQNVELYNFQLKLQPDFQLLPSSFCFIKMFHIFSQSKVPINDALLIRLLTSPYLESFIVDFPIPEALFRAVITEADFDPGIFCNLKYVNLCIDQNFSLDTWIQFCLCCRNGLEIYNSEILLTYEELRKLELFLRRNNIKVQLGSRYWS